MSPASRAGAVTEEDFRAALESLERAGVSPPPERVQELVAASAALLGQLVASRRHAPAIDFLRRLLALAPGDADLRRRLALAYGGHGESILQLADRLRVRPPPTLIDEMQSQFQQATDVSPALADLWWDLAVLSARFRGDLAAARSHLARARSLGYAHPLMPRLAAMLEAGRLPPEPADVVPPGERDLRELILMLALRPEVPPSGFKVALGARADADLTPFDLYVGRAEELITSGAVDADAFLRVYEEAGVVGGDAGEFVRDLLRVSAAALKRPDIHRRATEDHLRILVQMAFDLRSRADQGPVWLQRARRAARRARQIIETSRIEIDPDLHAEVLLALGQTFTHPSGHELAEAFRLYREALVLKRRAGNDADAARLTALLGRMIDHQIGKVHMATVVGGFGRELAALEEAHAAARVIGAAEVVASAALALGEAYRLAYQPARAIELLEPTLAAPEPLSRGQSAAARFTLASALSEIGRAADARTLQEALLTEDAAVLTPHQVSTLWANLGNSRRLLGDLAGAREAFERALEALPENEAGQRSTARAHLAALLGELEFLAGRPEGGRVLLAQAEAALGDFPDLEALRFHALAARCFVESDDLRTGGHHVDRARSVQRRFLARGTPELLESFLDEQSLLDSQEVEVRLAERSAEAPVRALLAAESAKGRLLAWLRRLHDPDAGTIALEPERHQAALDVVRRWATAVPGRWVVSLFGAGRGLAVLAVAPDGQVRGRWDPAVGYDHLAADVHDVWERRLARAHGGREDGWQVANLLTELLLDRVGQWLWRACPELADGGQDLVIVPHRLFRNIPISHCLLPGGKRLGEVFHRVYHSTSLADLADGLGAPAAPARAGSVLALADPDGSLPFARLEALFAAPRSRSLVGDEFTAAALREGLAADGRVVVACHGVFDADNPWRSRLHIPGSPFEVHELIRDVRPRASLVVLGVCEAGRSRRSRSDEPIGFPGLLSGAGVGAVVAPMWPVDDFASMIFLNRLHEDLARGRDAAESVEATASWLRSLDTRSVLDLLAALVLRVRALETRAVRQALESVGPRLDRMRDWLRTLGPRDRPFRAPLDWAAFQVTGIPR